MYILGISEIDNDAGAILLKDSEVVCGINEERLSRRKRHQGFPHLSIKWILSHAGITLSEIDYIAVAKADPKKTPELFYRPRNLISKYPFFTKKDPASFTTKLLNKLIYIYRNIPRTMKLAERMNDEISDWVMKNRCADKIIRIPHHYAHAVCAYWASGFDKTLAVTIDGQGEGISAQVYSIDHGEFKLLTEVPLPHSLGTFYGSVTKALGFKPSRHEGKITGLAAYAVPDNKLLDAVRRIAFSNDDGTFSAPSVYGSYPTILKLAKKYGPKKLSSAFQTVLEEVVCRFVQHWVQLTKIKNVVLAGGVVGNVKLNQRIHELQEVEKIFVFPHMADGGLCYGAAQEVYRRKSEDVSPSPIKNVYWGPLYTKDEVKSVLRDKGLSWEQPENAAVKVAELLADNKVIAFFNGALEFGPRALGSRTIMYPTTDASVNDWLNSRLDRSEFMPFAPVTLAEHIDDCYIGTAGAEFTAQFMTVTFNCTDKMKKQSPAVVHIDGTARPQIIKREQNPFYYDIIKNYHQITGIPSVVNTSFNMHEEPIVCSPEDAVRAFLLGGLDYLVIEGLIVKFPKDFQKQNL